MLHNAAKFDVDDKSFTQEIQQLGLPKENVDAVIKQYRDHKDALRVQLAKESYKVSNLLDVSWRVDQLLGSSEVEETFVEPLAHIKLQVDTQPQRGAITAEQKYNYGNNTDEIILSDGKRIKDVAFEITADKLDILIHELSAAHLALESLQN